VSSSSGSNDLSNSGSRKDSRLSKTTNRKTLSKKEKAAAAAAAAAGSDDDDDDDDGFVISAPTGPAMHRIHVDTQFKWSGQDPTTLFDRQDRLGSGAYGSVYKGVDKDGNVLAIKMVPAVGSVAESVEREINILRSLSNDNIVRYFGCMYKENVLWIMMEFCGAGSAGDLMARLYGADGSMREDDIACIVASALKGLVYLHSKGVIHRDVKAANILLTDKGDVKLADFGVSAQLKKDDDKQKTTIGTPLWMAPEVLNGDKYDNRCDVWSLGITAIELGEGHPPHCKENLVRAMMLIAAGERPTLQEPDKWSPEFRDFLSVCLVKDPVGRQSASDLLRHPFVVGALLKNPTRYLEALIQRKDTESSGITGSAERSMQHDSLGGRSAAAESSASGSVELDPVKELAGLRTQILELSSELSEEKKLVAAKNVEIKALQQKLADAEKKLALIN
jgi:serine/threonine protein kinase